VPLALRPPREPLREIVPLLLFFAAIVASFTTLLEVQTAYQLIDLEAAALAGAATDAPDG